MSEYNIQRDIIYPIDQYLAGRITEDEIEWYDWNSALYYLRKDDYWGVRKALTPYYRRLEKPSAFDPRGQATLPLTGKIELTLCGKIKLTPECDCHSGTF